MTQNCSVGLCEQVNEYPSAYSLISSNAPSLLTTTYSPASPLQPTPNTQTRHARRPSTLTDHRPHQPVQSTLTRTVPGALRRHEPPTTRTRHHTQHAHPHDYISRVRISQTHGSLSAGDVHHACAGYARGVGRRVLRAPRCVLALYSLFSLVFEASLRVWFVD